MLVRYKYRSMRAGTQPKGGRDARYQADSEDVKKIFKYEDVMWMTVEMPDGTYWYYNCGKWTHFKSYRSFMQ